MQNFDKILWRINGIIILFLSLAGLLFLSYLIVANVNNITRDREVTNIINNNEVKKDEYLYLENFERIKGNKLFLSALVLSQRYDIDYYSKNSSSIKNYLFFNVENNSKHWLFENHDYLILEKIDILKNKEIYNGDIIGFIFKVIKSDTNGDGIINYKDDKSILISNNFGKNLKIVLNKYDKLLGINQYENDKLIIFYLLNQKLYNLKIDLNNFEIIQNQLIKENIKNEKSSNT